MFGVGTEARVAEQLVSLGARRVLLLCQERHRAGADRVAAALGGRSIGIFSEVAQHVPRDLADRASARATELHADWVVAHGGGSTVGLAKAIALQSDVRIAAIPTTYAGSERTNIWGLSADGQKQTGRDDRVLPQLVVYDPELSRGLPLMLSQQSLLNAMAHSVEALYAADATPRAREAAAESLEPLLRALRGLAAQPDDLALRSDALYGAYLAGTALGRATMGLHHKLAHVLGGSFGLPHAPTHAVILPYVVAFNAPRAPEALEVMQHALGADDVPALLWDTAQRLGLPTAVSKLGLRRQDLARAAELVLEATSNNPRELTRATLLELLSDAWHDRRPSLGARRVPLSVRGPHAGLAAAAAGEPQAPAAVIVVHGRGSSAEKLLERVRRLAPRAATLHFVAPQAADNTWYPQGFTSPLEKNQPKLDSAVSAVEAAWQEVTRRVEPHRVAVVGFSQGACLLLGWLRQGGATPGQVVALSGAAIALPGDFANLEGRRVFLSASREDSWVPADRFAATAAELAQAGARVTVDQRPGDTHAITPADEGALARAMEAVMNDSDRKYQIGFGNALATEAKLGALPDLQNGPREVPYGLFAEQINGTPFTTPRAHNQRVWLYRLRPQITDQPFERVTEPHALSSGFDEGVVSPEVMRFRPMPLPAAGVDWLAGLKTFAGAGDPTLGQGMAIHLYGASSDMSRVFVSADSDLLIAPEQGGLRLQTELGWLDVAPTEIAIVPRSIRFRVELVDEASRGYVAEVFDSHLQLPDRGPVGANGMADERHFQAPVAAYENKESATELIVKQGGLLWRSELPASPFDVVAWHGRYAPFKYDLKKFNSLGSVSWDHPDPSILTVLSAPTATPGRNALDVAVFNGRWDPTEHTFRPPFFHRNSAIEFNAVLSSIASSGPWQPGAFSYTPLLTPHGVSTSGYDAAIAASDKPSRGSDQSVWLQFESAYQLKVQPWALQADFRDSEYLQSFHGWNKAPGI